MRSKTLDIYLEKQCSDNWCYASVIQALNRYYGLPDITQRNIAGTFNNPQNMQDPYYILARMELMNTTRKNKGVKIDIPSWVELTNSIDNGRPIVSYVGKHYILLIGYNGTSSRDTNRTYIFLDPLLGSEGGIIEVKYEDLKTKGFPTDYLHTGKIEYEKYRGSLFTMPPPYIGGSKRITRKIRKTRKTRKAV